MPDYITSKDICAKFGYCRQRLSQIVKDRGLVPMAKVGPTKLWPKDSMELFRPKRIGKPRKK